MNKKEKIKKYRESVQVEANEEKIQETIYKSVDYISKADVLIVGGTSLNVYPAAGLLNYYRGNKLVLINKSATPYDNKAALVIAENIGEVFKKIVLDK